MIKLIFSSIFVLDPRLKVFGDRKISELRAWFDNRLEDAIKAAEDEGKEGNDKVITQGTILCDC